ncbi:hypothetical protein GCM10027419_32980 [Pandoraea terrae]
MVQQFREQRISARSTPDNGGNVGIIVEVFARGGGGVSKVVVTFEKCEAHDTFEDARTSVPKLIQATSDAGYPSPVMQ